MQSLWKLRVRRYDPGSSKSPDLQSGLLNLACYVGELESVHGYDKEQGTFGDQTHGQVIPRSGGCSSWSHRD